MMMVAVVDGEASAGEHHSGNVEAWKNLGVHATHCIAGAAQHCCACVYAWMHA